MPTGGDDLGSDDEVFTDNKWMSDYPKDDADEDDDDSLPSSDQPRRSSQNDVVKVKASGKRSHSSSPEPHQQDQTSRKRIKSKNQLLLETGRHISKEPSQVQAAFLWTCFTHFLKLDSETLPTYRKFAASDFIQNHEKSLVEKIKAQVSVKRMKKWKTMHTNLVLIICSSARRAVALLKDIDSLHVRISKLFAKHMDMEDQIKMLEENAYAIAVGTPNRLLKLHHESGGVGGNNGSGALHFRQTELVIVDSWEDSKGFTVCTLNDTAPDLMKLMDSAIIPQMKQRPNIKLAFF